MLTAIHKIGSIRPSKAMDILHVHLQDQPLTMKSSQLLRCDEHFGHLQLMFPAECPSIQLKLQFGQQYFLTPVFPGECRTRSAAKPRTSSRTVRKSSFSSNFSRCSWEMLTRISRRPLSPLWVRQYASEMAIGQSSISQHVLAIVSNLSLAFCLSCGTSNLSAT